MKYNTSVLQVGKGSLVIDGSISLTEEIRDITLLEAKLHKCRSYSATETCEYFTTCRYNNPCPFITARKQVWSSFVDSIHPPMRCPFHQGTYTIKNASFDTSFIKSVAGMNGMYWDIKVKMYVKKKCITCFEVGIDFRKIRRNVH
ncbi:unnamed protein product [Nezara viridula]|uniref:Uncharacterized protein n=1 Tax=Nezara viridula TaxID=85310 RepID=A0A9P0H5W0_NEZVI|nr:unnamed protein product [Nezara viridula]